MVRPRRLLLAAISLVFISLGCSTGGATTDATTDRAVPADSVVAVYADQTLSLSEFETAYKKSNPQTPAADSLSAYKNFLEQYVNYRLKVRAAREAGLDTVAGVEEEIAKYRRQLAKPRILKKHIYEPLIQTLYERRQSEVDVSHILIRVPSNAAPKDTLKAYREMKAIADSVARGVPFSDLAYRNSEDPSAQKKGEQGYRGRLGYLRAGQLVPSFEKRMYSVPPDSVSDIFRTRFGYHILKVHDRRPTKPPIRLAHVMIRPDSTTDAPTQLLDSLRTAILRDSTTFKAVARQYSDDRRSASKGGDLGRVSSPDALPASFRDAVAQLDSVGTVSGVVKTQYGYHLIKLTGREELPSYEEAYDQLKKQIKGSDRVKRRKQSFARTVRAEAGVRVDTSRLLKTASLASLDTLARPLLSFTNPDTAGAANTPIAELGDSTYTLGQLARHVTQADGGARMSVGEMLDDFLNAKAFAYAQARLESRDPSFAAKMDEYRDGLLAFEFMQDSVWTKAARDTAALRRTFKQNRDRYRHPQRVRTIVLRAPADSLLQAYAAAPTEQRSLDSLIATAEDDSLLSVDTTLVTDESATVYQRVQSKADGSTVGPLQHDGDSLLLIRDTLLPARRKTFKEALSSVTQDYQDSYEQTVLRRLRQRYDVTTYPDRLRRAFASAQ